MIDFDNRDTNQFRITRPAVAIEFVIPDLNASKLSCLQVSATPATLSLMPAYGEG